jgi:hypothetical protein
MTVTTSKKFTSLRKHIKAVGGRLDLQLEVNQR